MGNMKLDSDDNEDLPIILDDEDKDVDVEEENEVIAEKETTRVKASKLFMYLFICVAAGGAGWATYRHMKKENLVWIYDEFEEFGEIVYETSASKMDTTEMAVTSLCDALTSFALDRPNAIWPNVTLPNFGVRARKTQDLAGMEMLATIPLVGGNNSKPWIDYAKTHLNWLAQDLEDLGLDQTMADASVQATEDLEVVDLPIWQLSPRPSDPRKSPILTDLSKNEEIQHATDQVLETRQPVVTPVLDVHFLIDYNKDVSDQEGEDEHEDDGSLEEVSGEKETSPRSLIVAPIYESFRKEAAIVGFVIGVISWSDFFDDILEDEAEGLIIDLENSCDNSVHSFRITESGTTYAGLVPEDPLYADATQRLKLGEEDEDDERRRRNLDEDSEGANELSNSEDANERSDTCGFFLKVHMNHSFTDNWANNRTRNYPMIVVSIFVLTGLVFLVYDVLVQRRQKRVMNDATKTQKIVSSLFPKDVRARMMENENNDKANKHRFGTYSSQEKSNGESAHGHKTRPIADLFPKTTVIFADMVGFTSWSSAREPQDVFELLESVYSSFDEIAKRRGVFKVETIGDCYVAVCGLPEPNDKHAVVMARFAVDILEAMKTVVKQLEAQLGPDTADLTLRVGLHSGPVTAGVLRGERARFQLFGDTVNVAARMESNGTPNRVHVSESTANLLIEAGKEHWVASRADAIVAKGKGTLRTFWVHISDGSLPSGSTLHHDYEMFDVDDQEQAACVVDSMSIEDGPCDAQHIQNQETQAKTDRLVDWSAEALGKILVQIKLARDGDGVGSTQHKEPELSSTSLGCLPLSEQKDSIKLPDHQNYTVCPHAETELENCITEQLSSFIGSLASLYRDNWFHNFDHACHVAMSTIRLLQRTTRLKVGSTYGKRLQDPLTQFALVFSSLIHDVDHKGVSNIQLEVEQTAEAIAYENKCIAEQTSIDVAWNLLMQDEFRDLRKAIYSTPQELERFRQIVVNCVLATDIFDKSQVAFRTQRWEDVFKGGSSVGENHEDKATTILLEHLIQLSDVSHTMQHWHVYRKWNEMLFMELYKAYSEGRSQTDPATFWYDGEIEFFDYYIIPLAGKFAEGGALEMYGDQMLSYSRQNKEEWMQKGHNLVAAMEVQAKRMYGAPRVPKA